MADESSSQSDHVYAVIASFLGWTLDAFDFFVLVFVVPAVAADFGRTIPDIALAISVTLAFRPVGAFIFGLMADRYGRRLPLMIDLVFFSIVEVLSGLAPNYATFMVLRALFGIGMGGEWGVGASLAMEKVPRRWRGVLSGLLQEGYATGYLFAACAFFFVYPHFGWRAMFFLGGAPALLAVFIRLKVKESDVWAKTRHDDWSQLGRAIVSNWRLFLYLALMMTMMNFVSHGTQDMYPTFLQKQRGFSPRQAAVIAMIYNVGAICGGIVIGYLSDRIGRRRAMVIALVLAIFAIPLWAYAPTTVLLVLGAFALQFMVQGAWGVVPAHLNELSPDLVRGTLPGFAYQGGNLLASITAPLLTHFAVLRNNDYAFVMSIFIACVAVFLAIVTAFGPEARGAPFGARAASGS